MSTQGGTAGPAHAGRVHEFTIGDRLRKAREVAGYDQRGFETASGISRATISAYELGKTNPRRAYLSIWANVTDTSLDWILYGDLTVRSPSDFTNLSDGNDLSTDARTSIDTRNNTGDHRSNPAQAHPAEGPSL